MYEKKPVREDFMLRGKSHNSICKEGNYNNDLINPYSYFFFFPTKEKTQVVAGLNGSALGK